MSTFASRIQLARGSRASGRSCRAAQIHVHMGGGAPLAWLSRTRGCPEGSGSGKERGTAEGRLAEQKPDGPADLGLAALTCSVRLSVCSVTRAPCSSCSSLPPSSPPASLSLLSLPWLLAPLARLQLWSCQRRSAHHRCSPAFLASCSQSQAAQVVLTDRCSQTQVCKEAQAERLQCWSSAVLHAHLCAASLDAEPEHQVRAADA